jgi:hypothetical protein
MNNQEEHTKYGGPYLHSVTVSQHPRPATRSWATDVARRPEPPMLEAALTFVRNNTVRFFTPAGSEVVGSLCRESFIPVSV